MIDNAVTAAVEVELSRARDAQEAGNEGMVRVCCRRAAGLALAALHRQSDETAPVRNAMVLLDELGADSSAPTVVRDAALRLRARRDEHGNRSISRDPVSDALSILHFVSSSLEGISGDSGADEATT
jgi:uncharacterized protein (UPF0147 family)